MIGRNRSSILACTLAITALWMNGNARVAHADPATSSPELGYDMGELQHPRTMAMGGAQYALGQSTSAVLGNPANLTLSRVYHFEALASFSPEARRQSYGGAVADSMTNKVAGGLAGSWSSLDPDGVKRTWMDFRVAAAYPLGDKLSIGLGGRYLRLEQPTGIGPFGQSAASSGTPDSPLVSKITFDAGATLTPIKDLHISVTGKNLTNPGTMTMPTTIIGAAGYGNGVFGVEADVLFDFTTYGSAKVRAMAGVEVFLADRFPIRVGYRYDDGSKSHGVGLGLGFVDKRFSADIGARRDFVTNVPATFFGASFRYFYDAGNGTPEQVGMADQ
jgi:opacity protein-like surface antigen